MRCPPVSQCIYSYALHSEVEIQGSWWQPPCFKRWLKHSYAINPSDAVLQRSFLIICFSNCPLWPHNFLFYRPGVLLGDKTCEELTKLEPENFRKPNRVTPKVKTSFTQYDFILLLKWIILHRNISGISRVSHWPRTDMAVRHLLGWQKTTGVSGRGKEMTKPGDDGARLSSRASERFPIYTVCFQELHVWKQ